MAADAPRKKLDVLYRPELDARTGALTVLVQSVIEPNWSLLRGGWAAVLAQDSGAASVKRVDQGYERLTQGDHVRFRLRANPTKRLLMLNEDGSPALREDGKRKVGARVELFRVEDQLSWLRRKAESGGFELIDARVDPGDSLGSKQKGNPKPAGDRGLTFGVAVFNGVLRVTEPDRFRETLRAGIGSGKAYGFGLLSVAPVP